MEYLALPRKGKRKEKVAIAMRVAERILNQEKGLFLTRNLKESPEWFVQEPKEYITKIQMALREVKNIPSTLLAYAKENHSDVFEMYEKCKETPQTETVFSNQEAVRSNEVMHVGAEARYACHSSYASHSSLDSECHDVSKFTGNCDDSSMEDEDLEFILGAFELFPSNGGEIDSDTSDQRQEEVVSLSHSVCRISEDRSMSPHSDSAVMDKGRLPRRRSSKVDLEYAISMAAFPWEKSACDPLVSSEDVSYDNWCIEDYIDIEDDGGGAKA